MNEVFKKQRYDDNNVDFMKILNLAFTYTLDRDKFCRKVFHTSKFLLLGAAIQSWELNGKTKK